MPAAWKRNARSPAIAMRCRTTRPRLKRARVSMGLVPEVGFGAVCCPSGVEGHEHRVVAEHPVADLVLDEDLLLVREIDHRSLQKLSMGDAERWMCESRITAWPRRVSGHGVSATQSTLVASALEVANFELAICSTS